MLWVGPACHTQQPTSSECQALGVRGAAGLIFAQDERAVCADWGAAALKAWCRQVQTLHSILWLAGLVAVTTPKLVSPSSTTTCFL